MLEVVKSVRGFFHILFPGYRDNQLSSLVAESSAIGQQPGAMDKPGSSFLWIGERHHLDREQVRELIKHLEHWVLNGRLQ